MMEIPSTPWRNNSWGNEEAKTHTPVTIAQSKWRSLEGAISHTFTHFHLELLVDTAPVTDRRAKEISEDKDFVWAHLDALGDFALPSVMRKVVKHALKVGY